MLDIMGCMRRCQEHAAEYDRLFAACKAPGATLDDYKRFGDFNAFLLHGHAQPVVLSARA